MPTIFSKIINGEIPCHRLAEDERFLAFLDIRPICPGHALVIPKKEIDYFFDMDDRDLTGIMIFARRVAAALREEVECKRIGVMVAGLEVPHAHVHLVPIRAVTDLNFANAKAVPEEELSRLAENIRKRL